MKMQANDVALIFNVGSSLYKDIAYSVVMANITEGKIQTPYAGTYHLICMDVGIGRELYYKLAPDDFICIDDEIGAIMDGVYKIKIDLSIYA